jgi:ketosteroid isomerase-like protein
MRTLIVSILFAGAALQAGARPAVLAADKTLAAGVATASLDKIMSVYSATPTMQPPDGDAVTGRDAVRQLWHSFLDQGVNKLELATTGVDTHGAAADERGTYTVSHKDGSVERGPFHSTWAREKGAWKLQRIEWK